MSYQAASGIYIIMVIIISCRAFITNEIPVKRILFFICVSIANYIIPLIFFKTVLLVRLQDNGDVSSAMLPLIRLPAGMLSNVITYIKTIKGDFKNLLIALIPFSIFLFIIATVSVSKKNRLLTFAVTLFGALAMFIFSYGAYIALQKPLWQPRAFVGFGFFIATLLTYTAVISKTIKSLKYLSFITAILISYNFLVFDLSYGNALAEQKQYQNFRITLLIADLNRSMNNGSEEPVIYIENNIGFAPVIENISKTSPLIKRMVYIALSGGSDWGHLPLHHYKFRHITDYDQDNGYKGLNYESLNVLVDNQYHTIKGNGNYFFVTLK
jgi:hypothetical protein